MSKLWSELVSDNPMLIEIQRYRRRFFSFSSSSTMNNFVLVLALLCYAGLLMVVLSARGGMPPIAIVIFQTLIFTLVAPALMYGAIAGEREKRTWDMLLVAPVSQQQIVVGKFIAGMSALTVIFVMILVGVLIALAQIPSSRTVDLLLAELSSYTYGMLLAAMTLFFSARSKRSLMALGTVLAILAILLVVAPSIIDSMLPETLPGTFINACNPFVLQAALLDPGILHGAPQPTLWAVLQSAAYLLLAVGFVTWASATLTFAEKDMHLLGKESHA